MAKNQLRASPDWAIPSEGELRQAVPGATVTHIENHHGGLSKIEIEALYMNDAGQKIPTPAFQIFEIPGGGRGRVPAYTPKHLAQIVRTRCEGYATKKRRKVQFIVYLFGSDAKSESFRHKFQFTIDGTPDDIEDEDEDADDDPEQDDDEDEDDVEEETMPKRQAQRAQPLLSLGPSPVVDPSEMEFMSANALARVIPQQVVASPSQDTARAVQSIQVAYSGALAEHRAYSNQVRLESQADKRESRELAMTMIRENRESMQKMLDFVMDRMQSSETRMERAESRIVEMSRLEGAQRESLLEITQQGWVAFIEGMKMKSEAIYQQQEYDRAFLGLQLQTAQSGNRRSAAGGVARNILPFAASGIAALLRSRGDEASAKTIDNLAMMFAPRSDDDDGDQDETQPEPLTLPQICVDARAFRRSLRADQVTSLRDLMPKAAWANFESACSTEIEAACLSCLTTMESFLTSDPTVVARVMALLEPAQQQTLMGLVAIVKSAQAPRGPTAPRPSFGNGASAAPPAPPGAAGAPAAPVTPPRRVPPRPGPPVTP